MPVYVITVDWKDRMFEPELVGVYANEDDARAAQNDKILELEEQGYTEDDDFIVWFEDTYVIGTEE